ncbi:MAG: 50S ribosomal protein L29 [Rickettsiaceae bacterium]
MNDKKVFAKNLPKKDSTELKKDLLLFKRELFNLRFQKASGDLKNTSRFKLVRKIIALIYTELNIRSKKGVCNA